MHNESDETAREVADTQSEASISRSKQLLVFIAISVAFSALVLIPFYGINYPALTDLPHHLLVNKLLWEHLIGISNLDLEVSWYLGYRLPTLILMPLFGLLSVFGISFTELPKLFAGTLVVIHAVVVLAAIYFSGETRGRKHLALTACLTLPAAAFLYSACWFMGFVGYTLAITLLVPTILFTEKYLTSGKWSHASLILLLLVSVYLAHPFAIAFWLIWVLCRTLVSIGSLSVKTEWTRIIFLGLVFLPVAIYQIAFAGLAPPNAQLFGHFPLEVFDEWYKNRFLATLNGEYLKTDDLAGSSFVSYGIVIFIFGTTLLGVIFSRDGSVRKLAVSGLLFAAAASALSEKFFPVPPGHWLAYNYRFASTFYVIGLAVGAVIILRVSAERDGKVWRAGFALIGLASMLLSLAHLLDVQKGYARFDAGATEYMDSMIARKSTNKVILPRTKWYPDTKFYRRYSCLLMPDCNPAGTLFRNLGGDLYPVKIKSLDFALPHPEHRALGPGNAFVGGEGYAGGQFSRPRGIALDIQGNIYVADTGNKRIQKFDRDGSYLSEFGHEAGLKDPTGIAVDQGGYIYVADPGRNAVVRFTPSGHAEKEWTGLGVVDIACGPNDSIYLLEQGLGRVIRFNTATETFVAFGRPGPGEGQFDRATGIAVGADRVMVADAGNNRIQIFDLDGRFIRQWQVEAWARYLWHYPDVAYDDKADIVYVTSGWSKEVLAFDLSGKLLPKLKLDDRSELNNVSSIAVDRTNMNRAYALSFGSDTVDNGDPMVALFDLP